MIAWMAVGATSLVALWGARDYVILIANGTTMALLHTGALVVLLILAIGSRQARWALRRQLYRGEHCR